jgi:HTH-type transcriptional regulator / antitoxin HigA
MDIRPIKTEADYDWALAEIEKYFVKEPAVGSPAAARFDVLAALIEAYEARVWPIEAPDAIDAIRETMEVRHLGQADLAEVLGSRSRASELLRRKRTLTMEQAWKLHQVWHIPAEALLRPHSAGSTSIE